MASPMPRRAPVTTASGPVRSNRPAMSLLTVLPPGSAAVYEDLHDVGAVLRHRACPGNGSTREISSAAGMTSLVIRPAAVSKSPRS